LPRRRLALDHLAPRPLHRPAGRRAQPGLESAQVLAVAEPLERAAVMPLIGGDLRQRHPA
jgi:hypothetical protein